jgi:hypothetical protein
MSSQQIGLRLINLHCYAVEENEFDDVYLNYNGVKIWPEEKKHHPVREHTITALEIDLNPVETGQKIVIELWDFDFLSPDDLYGTFQLVADPGGPYSTDLSLNYKETKKARYVLEWEVYTYRKATSL